jgi:hypothetical protein
MVGLGFSVFLRKSVMFRLGISAGIIGILIGCGGGGDGVSNFSSVGDGGAGDGNIPPAVDQAPMATISSPIDTLFNEGENIVFSGTGTDVEDGQLNDGALVWTSSIDGPIGTGPTLITSVLSPGDHDITLTATDSNGATHTTDPVLVHVEPTRFLKMGPQTTGVTNASNAFDGDLVTAATITTTDAEVIHFKAYIGDADTFFFSVKLGASTIGSSLAIEGLTADDAWQPINDIDLDADKTVTVKITDAQAFKDSDGYINLRALLVNDQSPDSVPIYELWRADPIYAGSKTIGVDNSESAFDGDRSTPATITNTLEGSGNFLHFKAYVGAGQYSTFTFKILLNNIGLSGHYLVIQVEDIISGNWEFVAELSLGAAATRTVSIQDIQSYLDADGYVSLRAYWFAFNTNYPKKTQVNVYEIWPADPFFVGPDTTPIYVLSPENAVDGNLDSFATIFYFWGESEHKDFLHVQTYLGDASNVTFSVNTAPSAPGSELIIDGEYEPDSWSVVRRISLDDLAPSTIELPNAREFVNADGYLSLRARWESDSPNYDAYIYEIRREEN